jgi:peptidoglycan/xylan/chitin deacetylase (PgdA/CDA1 family)
VACADPPKKPNASAGTAGIDVGDAGSGDSGGTGAVSGKGGGGSGPIAEAGAGGEGGEGGEPEAVGGEGGIGAGGEGGAPPADVCSTLTIGKSKIPVPPATSAVAKPSGLVGGLKVVNWAGFKGALSYTFDDSLQNQVTHYEEINAIGMHVTFYLVNFNQGSNPIWEKAAADGHELGNHTVHHCNANGSGCVQGTFAGIDKELDDNTAFIMAKAGVTGVYSFAHPGGDLNWVEPAQARFLLARGVGDASGLLPNVGSDTAAYNLPCHISATDEKAVGGFNLISDNVRTTGSWRTVLMHSVDMTIPDGAYQPVQLTEALAAMNYTKSLTDVWSDTVIAIGGYWRAQKTLTAVSAKTVGSDKVYSWTLPEHFPPGQYLRATVTGGKPKQCGTELAWDDHGYYEINLDAGSVTISP